ncbi:SET domain-containing protein [Salmonella bongori]|nr:SET domain-containing protein [Salmonella bongori]
MRGIGSVIHFHAPAANSTSATHLSRAWNDIRDWFPLTAQDEAARCFRVFYQPEEGTPPPDRLKHFLRLKALASPGRQANFTAERMVGTGETQCAIAAGKSSNFPTVTLLLSDPEWHAAHSQEELPLSVSSDSRTATVTEPGARPKLPSITNAQIQAWHDLAPEAKREAGSWKVWARAQGIAIKNTRNYLTNSGLTPRGVARLLSARKEFSSITSKQLQAWRDLTPEAKREAGSWKVWARAQGIVIRSAENYLTNSGLTPRGLERLLPAEAKCSSITDKQLRAWRDLTPEAKRESGGWRAWAQAQGINIISASNYLTNTGLTSRGVACLRPPEGKATSITSKQIRAWRDMTPEAKREAGGWVAWAQAQGISVGSARTFLTNTGLAPRGVMRLQQPKKRNAPVTDSPMQTWQATREAGGQRTWAQAQGISNERAGQSLPLADSKMFLGSTLFSATVTHDSSQPSTSAGGRGSLTVRADTSLASNGDKRALPLEGEDIPAPPTKQIKKEEDAVTWRTHQIDNNLPILQHWRDPTVSVMEQAEGGKEALQVTLWGSLFNRLPRETKARINQDVQWFLQNEGNHDARMNDMMTVSIPLDDSDGYRGRTVYARTDLPAFTVLGPYSGRLLESETVRCEYEKEYGKEASNYYFATRSQERIVSAWPQGNLLSLINNPVFGRRTAEAEARQNVSAVLVGKNITFYLTTRDISAGEELWFDYGPDYQHFEPGMALRLVQIKEEPLSPEEE